MPTREERRGIIMDTSEQYMKMCEKAEEIQGLRDTSHRGFPTPCFSYHENDVWFNPVDNKPAIWLPRFDQLQEMLDTEEIEPNLIPYDKLFHFTSWVRVEDVPFTSMEQLWLAFIMKEKFNKVWDGEIWIT